MYQQELAVARRAAHEAAAIIRRYASNRKELSIELKGRHDLVTEADVETEKKIRKVIATHFPDDDFFGEESHKNEKISSGRTWIVDPIDGTTNFAHGFPIFCVSIALMEAGELRVGVVLEVNSAQLFYAVQGQGAYLNEEEIFVSQNTEPSQLLLGTGFPYRDLDLLDDYMKLFQVFMRETHGVRRPGSACYDLCCMAAGWLDGFFEYALSPWDVAAGALIIKEAGGTVTDWEGGEKWLHGRRIICGNKDVHSYLLKRIRENVSEENRAATGPAYVS